MASLKGGDELTRYLAEKGQSTAGQPHVDVGFLEGSTYPDGTSTPMIAAINEFGAPSRGQPPRPYFRRMVAEKRATWGDAVAKNYQATNGDVLKTLDRVGQGIAGQLKQAINELTDPPLAPATIKAKGFDKPLIDTSHMINSVDYQVVDR
jgi:hypothetical protein